MPAAVATPLPPSLLRLARPVTAVSPGVVRTADDEIRCRAVVVAVDPPAAADLLPALPRVRMRALTTYYHAAPEPPLDEPIMLIDGDRRELLANTSVVSQAAPSYAPAGRHLVATNVVGPPPAEPVIRAELARLYGCPTADWEHLETVEIPAALPAVPPGRGELRQPVALGDGVFVAGDHRETPSMQGALESGWRAADAVVTSLRDGS